MNRTRLLPSAALLAVALSTTGCATDALSDAPSTEDTGVGHIHALGVDPADDSLYVATHFGLFKVDDTGTRTRVAGRWQDTMAFAVVGPNHFLGSGHPDLREDLPPHLGLIESTDAGETWTPLALEGEADFHILEPAGDVLYAYDATTGRLLRTEDRTSFEEVLEGPLISLAADGDAGLVGTDDRGRLLGIDPSSGQVRPLGGPTTVYVEVAPDGTLVGIDAVGVVHVSTDGAETWDEAGSIGAQPAALTISDQGWYAATATAVLRSTDDGETWTRVL